MQQQTEASLNHKCFIQKASSIVYMIDIYVSPPPPPPPPPYPQHVDHDRRQALLFITLRVEHHFYAHLMCEKSRRVFDVSNDCQAYQASHHHNHLRHTVYKKKVVNSPTAGSRGNPPTYLYGS